MQISLDKAVDGFIGFMADQVATIQKMGDRFLGFAALDGIKDALKSARCLMELMSGNGESTAVKAAAKAVPGVI